VATLKETKVLSIDAKELEEKRVAEYVLHRNLGGGEKRDRGNTGIGHLVIRCVVEGKISSLHEELKSKKKAAHAMRERDWLKPSQEKKKRKIRHEEHSSVKKSHKDLQKREK